jgi:transposase
MSNATPQVLSVERVDDIPVLLSLTQRLRVGELLDEHFPTHHLWKGELTFGEVVSAWLSYILSRADHRLCQLQDWAEQNHLTLQILLDKPIRALDFHDDRLADILDALADEQRWSAFEADLNRHTIRVYDLDPKLFRIDTTTASSYARVLSQQGLLQFGHSKDNDGLPQLKVAVAALDPLGLPVTCTVVAGNTADDPLYVPEIQKVQESFGRGGKTYVGDCKMAALATRAFLVRTKDFYLCPLAEVQLSGEQRKALLAPVRSGLQKLQPVHRPASGPGEKPELIAEGFCYDVMLQSDVDGQRVRWKERRWLVRSVELARSQQEGLEGRLKRATEQLEQLTARKQGKKRLSGVELTATTQSILRKYRVEGLLEVRVQATTQEKVVGRYGGRPERVVQEQDHRVAVSRQEQAIAQAKEEMGWQVYATNQLKLKLVGVVRGYREQYRIEEGWSRLKGRPLSLVPMYLETENRMRGLVLLLSLAVRVLTLLEWPIRQALRESGESLKGLYPGQPGRKTSRPSAELLLGAFRGVSLITVALAGHVSRHVTELTALQKRLLELWGFPNDLFQRLTLHCPEPPPDLSER